MIELTELFRADEPHKRFFLFDSGVRVKVHAVPSPGFGMVQWRMTGSHCDEAGKAIPYARGYSIHPEPHELIIASEADWTPEERAERIAAEFKEALGTVARRVEAAVLNERIAMDVFNRPIGVSDA